MCIRDSLHTGSAVQTNSPASAAPDPPSADRDQHYAASFLLFRSIWTVSYTHLDVYKRQEHSVIQLRPLCIIEQVHIIALARTKLRQCQLGLLVRFRRSDIYTVPVSYTHLDVYKRQHLCRWATIRSLHWYPYCFHILFSPPRQIEMLFLR